MLPDTLIETLHHLDHAAKLKAMQLLVNDLADEETPKLDLNAQYEVWSPFASGEAVAVLMKLLEETRTQALFGNR